MKWYPELIDRVTCRHDAGESWASIGATLGVTGEAVRKAVGDRRLGHTASLSEPRHLVNDSRMSRTLYRRFTMGATECRMVLADCTDPELAPLNPEETSCDGATVAAESLVLINNGLPTRERPPVVVHELLHMAFQTSGIGHTMRLNLKKEEQLIHALAPFLAQALVTGGFWKTPRGEE